MREFRAILVGGGVLTVVALLLFVIGQMGYRLFGADPMMAAYVSSGMGRFFLFAFNGGLFAMLGGTALVLVGIVAHATGSSLLDSWEQERTHKRLHRAKELAAIEAEIDAELSKP